MRVDEIVTATDRVITSDFFSFLHISWSNRPGIIWNVQNRPWQHMSIRYGRGLRIFQLWIWNLTFRYFQTMILRCCASGSSRPPPPELSGELGSQAPYVTLLHTELGSLVRPTVSAAADGKTRWRTNFHRRRFFFLQHNNRIRNCKGLSYGKFSNLKIVEVMCMHLGCISKLS